MTDIIPVRNRHQLEAQLEMGGPLMIFYRSRHFGDLRASERQDAVIKRITQQDVGRQVRVVVVDVFQLPREFLQSRGLTRLPALSFHDGEHEYERQTRFTSYESVARCLKRLTEVHESRLERERESMAG